MEAIDRMPAAGPASGEPVSVLALRTLEGVALADGDLVQTARGRAEVSVILSFVAATPKPRLVQLNVSAGGGERSYV